MVARRDSDLLAEIERDVLDESKSVAAALRKCLALGGQAKSAELRDWASRELHGYPDEVPLPDYRKIRTPLLMDGFTGGGIFRGKQVSVIDLPQEARDVMGDERVYWSVGTGVLRGVVDAIRTTLTELVAEIRAGMAGGDVTPSPDVVGQAVQFAVYGKGNRITVAAAGPGGTATVTSSSEEPEESRFWTWRRAGAIIVGLATIAGTVAAILAPF
jgi:AbiTii-like protein